MLVNLESLKVNVDSRLESFDGKEHLVFPVVALVEGVHNDVYYPISEIEKSVDSWNGVPVPIDHPRDEAGTPISANSPKIIDDVVVGRFFNASFGDGKLKGEVWIDVEKANLVDPEVIKMLENGKEMEVSTGLFTEFDAEAGKWGNEPYLGTVINYRPDHLALLPYTEGACSHSDGCGIRTNETLKVKSIEADELGDNLGAIIDQKINSRIKDKEVIMDLKELVGKLIANERTKFEEGDSEMLLTLSKCQLESMVEAYEKEEEDPVTIPEGATVTKEDGTVEVYANGAWEVKEPEAKEGEDGDADPVTAQQYIDDSPPEIKAMLANSLKMYESKKKSIVSALLDNANCKFTQEQLEAKDMDELEALQALAAIEPNYEGAGGDLRGNASDDEIEILEAPTMSWG